ncbi:uncharacterized protein LOC114319190 [Camellia sinensis]|uniref:uncharacterized protein LOC114319190 n=1 Tax=Camellia sinensis TaxID=4442 RepID=UPI0010358514|nr:uncharacterized protein LOC114319190 [Camellia sinensis]
MRKVKEILRQKKGRHGPISRNKKNRDIKAVVRALWPEDLVDFVAVSADGSAGGMLCVRKTEVFELIDCCSNKNYIILSDVSMIERKYTWCNSQVGERWSRLDRFLVSPEWLEWFRFKLWGLSRLLSDHCLLILMEDDRDWDPRPFRFLNAWVLHPTFINKVNSVWESTHVDGWAEFRLKIKLKSLKEALKVWNNEMFGNVEFKLKEAEDAMHALDLAAEVRPLQNHEVLSRREIKWEISKMRKMKEWRQSRNLMDSITIKGNTFNKLEDTKQEIARYFGEAFAENWSIRPKIGGVFKTIEPSQAELLVKGFSESELWATIKECDGNKAPRPDGLNLICIQKG